MKYLDISSILLALITGTQNHHTKVTFRQYEH